MADIVLRQVKGAPLTNLELDNNFSRINVELSNVSSNVGVLSNLATSSNSNIVAAVNSLSVDIGDLALLTTSNTANLVAAINEAALTGAGGGLAPWSNVSANYTAVAQDRLLANTAASSFTITLPATPAEGDEIYVADGYDFSARSANIGRNGKKIAGAAQNLVLSNRGVQVQLVYDGSSNWNVYYVSLQPTKESLGLGTANTVTFNTVIASNYKDSSNRTLKILDQSNVTVWGD